MDQYEALQYYFGHSQFRQGQEALIDAILSGRDVLGIMPTGGGKSLCYQIPALVFDGVTLVQQAAHPEANIIFGSIFDENMEDEMRVTVIATGFDDADEEPEVPSFSQISSQVTQQEPAPAPVPEPTPAPAPQTPQESFFQAVEFDPFSTATQQQAAPAPEQPKAAPAKKDPFDDLMEMFNRRK